MIGTELLIGQIVDTNAAFMGKTLAENGINLYQKTTVGDNARRITRALSNALDRADVVLTSGGLGPTEDDITRECIAELLDRPLEFRQDLFEQLAARFARMGRTMSENNKKQAYAPRGAVGIRNEHGTAPGLIIEDARGVIICMPGVPLELHAMLTDSVVAYLRKKSNVAGLLHWRVLHVCGLGESNVDNAIGDLIAGLQNPTVGVLASPRSVRIRIAARAGSIEEANKLIDPVDQEVRRRLPGLIMGADDAVLEGVVDKLLVGRGWTLAVAETLTGGMICQRLVSAQAASFKGGTVLPPGSGAHLSLDEMALDEAERVRQAYAADCGLAVMTDLAARSTFMALATPEAGRTWQTGYADTEEILQSRAATLALEYVRRYLAGVEAS